MALKTNCRYFLFAALMVFAVSGTAMAGSQDFTLINGTGQIIREIYLSPTHESDKIIAYFIQLNSDQGSQFTSDDYKHLLKELGIRQSMDGKSRWADNIMIERWFRSLKTEAIYPNEFASPRELRQLINSYVKDYNTIRPHESLDYMVPNDAYYGVFPDIA